MFIGVCGAEAIPHFIYAAATAHPAAVLAARDLGMQVHVILDRVKHHGAEHGRSLLRDAIFKDYWGILRTGRCSRTQAPELEGEPL